MMAMALGGRAAEQIFFGRVSTGASDDLQKVTRIAQAQVTTYGMSTKLGNVSYAPGQGDSQFVKPFSEATAQAIDEEVRMLISATYERTLALLEKHRAQVALLASKLIELENVNHDILLEILGPRPFASDAYTLWRKQSKEAAEEAAQEAKAKKEAEEKARAANQDQEPPELAPA
jgi:ATP-dependent Zn protease